VAVTENATPGSALGAGSGISFVTLSSRDLRFGSAKATRASLTCSASRTISRAMVSAVLGLLHERAAISQGEAHADPDQATTYRCRWLDTDRCRMADHDYDESPPTSLYSRALIILCRGIFRRSPLRSTALTVKET
jgi:hypothetical protein